jgi:hypothetical protein
MNCVGESIRSLFIGGEAMKHLPIKRKAVRTDRGWGWGVEVAAINCSLKQTSRLQLNTFIAYSPSVNFSRKITVFIFAHFP